MLSPIEQSESPRGLNENSKIMKLTGISKRNISARPLFRNKNGNTKSTIVLKKAFIGFDSQKYGNKLN